MSDESLKFDLDEATLSGDVRDALLGRIRTLQKPWQAMTESEQREVNAGVDQAARELVRLVVQVVQQHEHPVVHVEVGAVKIDKGVEVKLSASSTVENITALAEHGKRAAVLVLADPDQFIGERAPAEVTPDQADLIAEQGDE